MNEGLNLELLDAVFKGKIKKVKSILDKGLTMDEANVWGKKAMKFAIKRGQMEIMQLLYERGFYTADSGVFASIFFNDFNTLKKLLETESSDCVRNALFIAVSIDKCEIVKILLNEYHVDFNSRNKDRKTPLDVAKENEQSETYQFLSKYEYNNNQLIRACKCLKTEQVKMYIKKGANVNFKDEDGTEIITHAKKAFCKDNNAIEQRREIINILLAHGAK